jgi:hypothetical protein
MDCKVRFACVLLVTCSIAVALDVTVQQFKESPGLYYDHTGEAQLYKQRGKLLRTYVWRQLMTISELYVIMHKCPLTFVKSININFGSITLGV